MQINELRYGDTESGAFGITCGRETHYLLPEQVSYMQEIPGMDGAIDFGIGGYKMRVIPVDLYYDGPYDQLRINREAIIAWLYSKAGEYKQLEFGNEPGKYYMAKILTALDFTNSTDRKIGTVQFTCNPPWQYQNGVLLTPDQIAWNTQDNIEGVQWAKEFMAAGSLRLTNTGLQPAKPVIKLLGYAPSGVMLTHGTEKWQYTGGFQDDGIKIDCAAETVTRMSDGANMLSYVSTTYDTFFTLPTGKNEIALSAAGLGAWPQSLTMLVEFNPAT